MLYVVATPIGNLGDLSPRARDTLAAVDLILAEDTRLTRRLLDHHHIATPMRAHHAYNERGAAARVIAELSAGRSIALVSDAGTPLISDPGYALVRAAHEAGVRVLTVPGPCAAVAALAASGLPADTFVFEGFLPAKSHARRARLAALAAEARTLIFYEAPHRVLDCVGDLVDCFGPEREACVARELTKVHETVRTATLGILRDWMAADPDQTRGEFVLVVRGAAGSEAAEAGVRETLSVLLRYLKAGDAAAAAAALTGIPRNRLYKLALAMSGKEPPAPAD